MTLNDELLHLEAISQNSLYAAGVNRAMVEYSFRIARRFVQGRSILEMGPAEGVMTELLVQLGKELTVVEGSQLFCDDLAARFPGIHVEHALFEEFEPRQAFDTIVLGHVLEHVQDPVAILSRVREWLTPEGRVFAAVPNARSLHRQAAVMMGLLAQEDQLNDTDRHHGHRRVFNPESFRSAFTQAGLKVDYFGGYWIKPVSNSQIEATWTPQMVEAFMALGERYPDIAAEIYVVASA
ncbi:MAG: class I SAM-dependent methyltransferase [Alcaligenes sp.]